MMSRSSWVPEGGWPAYHRARCEAAAQDGLCLNCMRQPRKLDRRKCQGCIDWHKQYRVDRIAGGKCRDLCGRDANEGRTRCIECLDRHARKARAKRGQPVDAPIVRRAPRRDQPSTSIDLGCAINEPQMDGPRKGDSAHPAEVDLSQRKAIIAALATRRAA